MTFYSHDLLLFVNPYQAEDMEAALLNDKNDDDDYAEDDDEVAADMEEFEESGMLENDEVGKPLNLLPSTNS